ncbi:MAG: amino acid adenylation domain-containing protein, partial [Acidobacteria bacterium]|nr:amino acid adenylation domain-containing protein [Acidobacteriota bacterium]
AEIWAGELNTPLEKISRDADFFSLGGHSLKAINIIAHVHKHFQVKLELDDIFAFPILSSLAQHIRSKEETIFTAIEPAEEKEFYPLSSAQKRLFILHRLEPDTIGYNLPGIMEWHGSIDKERLEHTIRQLIERHESFRTGFFMINDEPVQKIYPTEQVHFEVEYIEYEKARSEFIRYFDLSRPPLLRLGISKLKEDQYLVLLDMHHIIVDGVSEQIFMREFHTLYQGTALPILKLRYRDYAEWQNNEKRRMDLQKQEAYWLKQFAGETPVLDLPVDFKRPLIQDYKGDKMFFNLGLEETRRLKELTAKTTAVTLYMVVLAVVNVFLAKLSGQEDIIVGTPTAGRRHADLQGLVGMLVNTLALRNNPESYKTFNEFLKEIKTQTLEAFENQDFQFEELVEKVSPQRDLSRNPLFDTMFALHNQADDRPGEPAEPDKNKDKPNLHRFLTGISYFDLSFHAFESDNILKFSWHYSTALFKRETILRFTNYFHVLVAQLLANPDTPLAEIEIISTQDKNRILYEFNNTETDCPEHKTIRQLFAEQVTKTPDRIAVSSHGRLRRTRTNTDNNVMMSYRQLDEQSNQLAGLLIEKGALTDTIIGIIMERSVEMVISILAAWKSGAAYLPIDPQYPQERIDYMLKDSNAAILLTDEKKTGNCQCSIVNCQLPMSETRAALQHSHHLAYVIYTSGSTGKPKGVMVEHPGMLNHIYAKIKDLNLDKQSIIAQNASHCFDISVWQFFAALVVGGKTVIYNQDIVMDTGKFLSQVYNDRITILEMVPSYLSLFIDTLDGEDTLYSNCNWSLKYLLTTGEVIKPTLVNRCFEKFKNIKVVNAYGPTEASDDITHFIMAEPQGTSTIPIGTPLQNFKIYICDQGMKLCPIGVKGEILVSGIGVGRGYLNNTHKTHECFIKDPFRKAGGVRLYKTGDIGRYLEDGRIEFLGRSDTQVKIRGFRIEISEIEMSLLEHNMVKETAAVVRQDEKGIHYLCAYIVPHIGSEFQPDHLRQYLEEKLPEYMVPKAFVF